MRNLILSSIILLFSLTCKSDMTDIKDVYSEVNTIIKLYCKPDQYFSPNKKTLIRSFLDYPVIGLCETDRSSFFNIYIDTYYWEGASDDMRFELMAHECLHCLFFAEHSKDPDNFMYYQIRKLTKDQTKQQLVDYLNKKCGV